MTRPTIVALALAGALGQATVLTQADRGAALARIHQQYLDARAGSNIDTLVVLDGELRRLLRDRPNNREFANQSNTFRSNTFRDLGLSTARHGEMDYTGKLLLDAHAIDPRSRHRRSTLFATVWPNGYYRHVVPAPVAGERYLKEFPSGPFSDETRLTLARFHDDLFKLLRWLSDGGVVTGTPARPARVIDMKYHCYAPFLTDRPFVEQQRRAQEVGLVFYRQLLTTRPADADLRRELVALETGSTTRWFYCFEAGS